MHTNIGGIVYFPEGATRDTSECYLVISIDGEARHAYTDRTIKKVSLSIKEGKDKILLSRQYQLSGSDLSWDVTWKDKKYIKIVFYDYGDGISSYQKNSLSVPPRQMFILNFNYDKKKNSFNESNISQNILNKLIKSKEKDESRHIFTMYMKTNNKEKDISIILKALEESSDYFDLKKQKVSPGYIGRLAHFYEKDFRVTLQYYDPLAYHDHGDIIEINIEGYGRQKLSDDIRYFLKQKIPFKMKEKEVLPKNEIN
ncbi:MAG: hypothetical protein GY828_02345 [Candidatus Gracilibacteria bacterium]|nr:hypothetical protein [Candidatus Gracilibacteria bacterium]